MNGCKKCPAFAKCAETYRGSGCAALRYTYGLESDPKLDCTDRERLIELIGSTKYGNGSLIGKNFQLGFIEKIADHLLSNGVTFVPDTNVGNMWISVEDRLPTEPMEYIVMIKGGANATTLLFDGVLWFSEDPEEWRTYYTVTHWMPLPEPPEDN